MLFIQQEIEYFSTDLRLVILVMKHFCSYCFSAVFKCFIIDTIIIIIIIIIIISVVNYYLGVAQGWTVRITQPWGGGGGHTVGTSSAHLQ